MTESMRAYESKSAARVDSLLFRVRWILWLLVIPFAWVGNDGQPLPVVLWVWLAALAVANLATGAILYFSPRIPERLPAVTFVLDVVLFGALPHLAGTESNLLTLFVIYPAMVGAVRFGPQVGLIAAGVLALPIEARAFLPMLRDHDFSGLSSGLLVAALLAATALIVYLLQREKEVAIKRTTSEIDELRHAIDGARLLYRTTDTLSSSTSYAPILEAMLEAGVKGLPQSRREDGLPIGIALFFESENADNPLRVTASKHLSRRDCEVTIPGKAGAVAESLQSGNPVISDDVRQDPELMLFPEMARCRSALCLPLQAGLEQYGVVVLASPAPRRPSPEHLELMRAFTNQAAIAFQNAKLYQNLRAEHDQTLRSDNEMRQKLARDLHDGPTQKISGLVMQLDYISRLLDRNPTEAKAEVKKAHAVAQQTVKEIRTSLFSLRPLSLETKGLSTALEQFCQRLQENENVPIQIDPGKFGSELDGNIAATVFAIIDEAVNNARKHAPGAPIHVRVTRQKNALLAVVQDQGPGFDLHKVVSSYDERSSLGLQNMKERAKLIDGELRIDSELGRGTRITLVVPLPQPIAPGSEP